MMKNLRVPIKIATKKDKVGGIEFNKFKKFAILQNERMNKNQDTRPLKPQAYIKLKNCLEPASLRALEKIVQGESLGKGTKLAYVEPIIRFLIIELNWREGQPSRQNEENITLSLSLFEASQSVPADPSNPSDVQGVTRSSTEKGQSALASQQIGNETMSQFWSSEKAPDDPVIDKSATRDLFSMTQFESSQSTPDDDYSAAESAVRDSTRKTQVEFILEENVDQIIDRSEKDPEKTENIDAKMARESPESRKPFECSHCCDETFVQESDLTEIRKNSNAQNATEYSQT